MRRVHVHRVIPWNTVQDTGSDMSGQVTKCRSVAEKEVR